MIDEELTIKAKFRDIVGSINPRQLGRRTEGPGVDVIITIFCDFWQYSAKKLAFFSKTNVILKILYNLGLFRVKNANSFAEIFGEKYLKNYNIGPWLSENSPIGW
jgi:hypothetical protein